MFSEPCSGRLSDGLVTINIPLKEAIRSSQFVGRKGKYDSFSQLALFRLPIFHFTNQYPGEKVWAWTEFKEFETIIITSHLRYNTFMVHQ
jgi:hypothetical protein